MSVKAPTSARATMAVSRPHPGNGRCRSDGPDMVRPDGIESTERASGAGTAGSAEPPRETRLRVTDFDEFYRQQYRSIVGLGVALTGNRQVAEDLAQDAFTEVHKRWSTVSTYEHPEAWLRRVLINKSHSRGRRLLSEARMLAKVRMGRARTEDDIRLPDQSTAVWEAVRTLPRRQAEAITLRYWDDLSVAEVARILDVGEESIKTHLKRGRARLAELIGEDQW